MKKTLIFFLFSLGIFALNAQGIFISGKTYQVDTLVYRHQAGPGVFHSSYRLPALPLDFQVMEIDLKNPYIQLETCKAGDKAVATEKPTSMGLRKNYTGHEVVGGTNGDFYFTVDPEIGMPRSGQLLNGEIIANPTGRASFILGMDKKPYIDRPVFRGDLISGANKIRIHTVNLFRLEAEPNATNLLTLYTDKFGTTTGAITGGTKVIVRPKTGTKFAIQANDTVTCIVESIQDNTGTSSIPAGKAVLHGRDAAAAFLQGLTVGSEVTMAFRTQLSTTPNLLYKWKEQVGGSDCIVLKNGTAQNEGKTAASGVNPRTGMGFSKDSTTVFMIVVDGRTNASAGLDLTPFGELCKAVGAWNAVNLDGGGSSVMFVNKEIKNYPSGGVERAVGNGVLVVSTAPADNVIAMIKPEKEKVYLPQYGYYKPVFRGYNQYGALISKNVQNVKLTVDPKIGEILGDSLLFASGAENGMLYADYNGLKTSILVTKMSGAKIKIRLDSVLFDNAVKYSIEVQSTLNDLTMPIDARVLNWTVENPQIAAVEQGVLRGLSNGKTLVIGTLDNIKDTLKVNVEISDTHVRIAKEFTDKNWTFTNSTQLTNVSYTTTNETFNVKYTYNIGRYTNINLNNPFRFYSLPDTFKVTMNPHNSAFSTINFRFTENGNASTITKQVSNFVLNQDNVISLPIDKIMVNPTDRGAYPISFYEMQFVFNTDVMVDKTAYEIDLKNFTLVYNNVPTGIFSPSVRTNFKIYPNPVSDRFTLEFANTAETNVSVSLYTLSGQKMQEWNFNSFTGKNIGLSLKNIQSGAYLLNVKQGNKSPEIIKLIKK